MKIKIICVGKLKEKYLKDAQDEYLKRMSRFAKLNIIELSDEKIPDNTSISQIEIIKNKEAEKIDKNIKQNTYVIALDLKGEHIDSLSLSKKIESLGIRGKSDLTFIIGGSLGLSKQLLEKADYSLCLSKLTFPHQIARILLLEQLYRSFKIINNETYHK